MIFENCIIQAPDGVNLSRCGKKKLNWYLDNELADLISNDPPIIRLKFEPSGREGLKDPLLLEGKPNICVVCGVSDDLTRHHIIPYSFIKHMQIEYKVDIIRDIFPLCRTCHNAYEKKSTNKRKELSKRFGVPVSGVEDELIGKLRKATGAASALLFYKDKIPQDRQEQLMNHIRNFLCKTEITNDDLQQVCDFKITKSSTYVNFSEFVAKNITDYDEFAKEWRTHFVETMQPKFMPAKWKVDRKTNNIWVPKRFKD